jgi:hypothetical protein
MFKRFRTNFRPPSSPTTLLMPTHTPSIANLQDNKEAKVVCTSIRSLIIGSIHVFQIACLAVSLTACPCLQNCIICVPVYNVCLVCQCACLYVCLPAVLTVLTVCMCVCLSLWLSVCLPSCISLAVGTVRAIGKLVEQWSEGRWFEPELDSDHILSPITINWFAGVSMM